MIAEIEHYRGLGRGGFAALPREEQAEELALHRVRLSPGDGTSKRGAR